MINVLAWNNPMTKCPLHLLPILSLEVCKNSTNDGIPDVAFLIKLAACWDADHYLKFG